MADIIANNYRIMAYTNIDVNLLAACNSEMFQWVLFKFVIYSNQSKHIPVVM